MKDFMIHPDVQRFSAAKAVLGGSHNRYNIGTYRERSQHLVLKYYFEPDKTRHEVPLEGYVADIYSDGGIFEIQTSGFGALRGKLEAFLRKYPVTLVYPSAIQKRTLWTDPDTGEIFPGSYRKSKRGRFNILSELCGISAYFPHPNLRVLNFLTAASDYKLLDGFGKDRKGRATKTDTVPDELLEIVLIKDKKDILKMLPFSMGDSITNAELSKTFGMRGRRLWKAVKFLENAEILRRSGKRGNAILYTVAEMNK